MNENVWPLILLGGGLLAFLLVVSFLSKNYSLNNFKSKTVGDGQHGTARWATPKEIRTTYHVVPFRPRRWRKGEDLPTVQGISWSHKKYIKAEYLSDELFTLSFITPRPAIPMLPIVRPGTPRNFFRVWNRDHDP